MLCPHESVQAVPDGHYQASLAKLYESHKSANGLQNDDACGAESPSLIEPEETQHKVFGINGKKRLVFAATHVSLAKEYDENTTEAESKSHRSIKIAEEALDNVLRNDKLHHRDSLGILEQLCASPEGWIVAWALRGNGWNAGTGRMEMQPHAADAIRRLAHGISSVRAVGAIRRPPKHAKPIFVAVDEQRRRAEACPLRTRAALLLPSALQLASLRALSLAAQNLAPRHLGALLPALLAHPALEDLDLSNNPLGAGGAALLAARLQDPRCPLRALALGACQLPTGACVVVLEAAQRGGALLALSLERNDVGAPGAAAAARLLAANGPLEALNLNLAAIPAAGMDLICSAVLENSRLETLLVEGNLYSYSQRWREVVGGHRHLRHLALEAPSDSAEVDLLAALWRSRQPVRPCESLQLAVAMGLHPRLGAASPLRVFSEHFVELLLDVLDFRFRLELVVSPARALCPDPAPP